MTHLEPAAGQEQQVVKEVMGAADQSVQELVFLVPSRGRLCSTGQQRGVTAAGAMLPAGRLPSLWPWGRS